MGQKNSPMSFLKENEFAAILNEYNKALDEGAEATAKFLDSGTGNDFMDGFLKDLNGAPATMNGYRTAVDNASAAQKAFTASTIKARIATTAFHAAVTVGISVALSGLIQIIMGVVQAQDNLKESAEALGQEFSSTKTEIEDYKTQIDELQKIINDDSSSYEESSEARRNLLAVQDEIIEKFGKEAEVISASTEMINGNTDAISQLTEREWQETLNKFNSNDGKTWYQKIGSDLSNFFMGYSNNYERMISEMERKTVEFSVKFNYTDEYESFIKQLEDEYGAKVNRDNEAASDIISIEGENLKDLYSTLLSIQSLASNLEIDASVIKSLDNITNGFENTIEKYEELYNQSILQERILKNDDYTDLFKEINDAYKEYQEAFEAGNEEQIEVAKQNFAEVMQGATEGIDDQAVIDFFHNMYPDLLQEVGSWNFTINFNANTDNLKDEVSEYIAEFSTSDEIINYNPNLATDEQVAAYEKLEEVASNYFLTIEQLVELLNSLGLIQSQAQQDLLDKLIPSNDNLTAGFGAALTNANEKVDPNIVTDWVNGLSQEDAILANSEEFTQALEERKASLDNTTLSVEDYNAALQEVKDAENQTETVNPFEFLTGTDIGERLTDINKRFQEGTLSYKEYFKSLNDEIRNVDFSNYTNSVEDAKNASIEFFITGIQQTATGLQDLIAAFNDDNISVSEYLDGYTAIGETLSSLTDYLQENSDAWYKEGESLDSAASDKLDKYQESLSDTIDQLNEFKDSNYSLSQILAEDEDGIRVLDSNSDEFKEHVDIIAEDLARIANESGVMSEEVKSRLGSTTEEIAASMNNSIANQQFAAEVMAANTNAEITNMAESIGTLFDVLADQIQNLDFSISIGVRSIKWSDTKLKLGDTELPFSLPEVEFGTKISSSGLDSIAGAVKDFGNSVKNNIESQQVSVDDYKNASSSGYQPDVEEIPETNAAKAGKEAADEYLEAFEKEYELLNNLLDWGLITEKEYLDQLRALYEKYFKDREKYLEEYMKYEQEYLEGMRDLYNDVISYIIDLLDDQIDAYEEQKDAAVDALEEQRDAAIEAYEAQKEAIEEQIKAAEKQKDALQDQIDAKQDEIDAINEAAEARQREIDKQKAQYELERARNQRTKFIYRDGQMVYEADPTAIRDAEEELDDIERDEQIAAIEKEIKLLEKQQEEIDLYIERLQARQDEIDDLIDSTNDYYDGLIESTEKYWDGLIEGLEEYKSRWEELADIEEQAKMVSTIEQLGFSTENILAMSTEEFERFKEQYLGLLSDLYSSNYSMLSSIGQVAGADMFGDITGYLEQTQGYIDSLNQIDLTNASTAIASVEEAFKNAAIGAGEAANMISGTGGTTTSASGESSSGSQGKGQEATAESSGGSGGSFKQAIEDATEGAVPLIGEVAGAFYGDEETSVTGSVEQAKTAIGTPGDSGSNSGSKGKGGKGEGEEGSDSLSGTLQSHVEYATSDEGIPAETQKFVELKDVLTEINELLTNIQTTLESLSSNTYEIKVSGIGSGLNFGGYATGVKNLKEKELAWTQEKGAEIIVSPTRNAILTPLEKGDSVINDKLTDNLLKWGTIDPSSLRVKQDYSVDFKNIPVDIQSNSNKDIAPNLTIDNVSFNCTGVTGEQVLRQIEGSFKGLFLNAYQQATTKK